MFKRLILGVTLGCLLLSFTGGCSQAEDEFATERTEINLDDYTVQIVKKHLRYYGTTLLLCVKENNTDDPGLLFLERHDSGRVAITQVVNENGKPKTCKFVKK